MRWCLLLMGLWVLSPCWGQMNDTTYSRYYDFWGGYDLGQALVVDSSGYYFLGTATDYAKGGVYSLKLLKTDFNGNLIWQKSFGENGLSTVCGGRKALTRDLDGNFYIAGNKYINGNNAQALLAKIGPNGDSLWFRFSGGLGYDTYYNLHLDSASNTIYTAGYTQSYGSGLSDFLYAAFDSSGQYLVNSHFGFGGTEGAVTISKLNDSLVIGGIEVPSGGSGDPIIVVIDSTASQPRKITGYGTTANDENLYLIHENGVWAAWGGLSGVGSYVAVLDSAFNIIWREPISYFGIPGVFVRSLTVLPDSSVVVVGKSQNGNNPETGVIFKYDKDGNRLWSRKLFSHPEDTSDIDGSCSFYDVGYDAFNGFLIAMGVTSHPIDTGFNSWGDFWVVKLDTAGCINLACLQDFSPDTICPPPCDTITNPCPPICDTITNPCLEPCDTVGMAETLLESISIYPNPANGQLYIDGVAAPTTFSLFSMLGETVLSADVTGRSAINISGLPVGLYLYELRVGELRRMGRLVVE